MKRSALASLAALAILSVTACSGAQSASPSPSPAQTPSALPTSTITPSMSPAPADTGKKTTPKPPPKRSAAPRTPRPSPASPAEIAGAIGQVPEGFKLPDEDVAATEEVSAFETTVWRASCPDRVLTLAAASGIQASRIKESVSPEHVVGNGLLVFADETAADAFLTELDTQLADCTMQGPPEEGWRTLQVAAALDGLGDDGLQIRQWSEWDSDGSWVEGPGAALQYLARKGRFIVLTYEGGEYQGDPAGLPELVADVEARISAMLAQV